MITAGYLTLLFAAAYLAERMKASGRSIVANPYIYSLSMAVYCTSWTFYGSVGKAATSGLSFLTTYLGPTLMAALWWLVLRKIVTICRENRITTISDFIGSRYGNSLLLSALVTVVAAVGISPYLGLQIKAIITTFTILSGEPREGAASGMLLTVMVGVFAMIFGARRLGLREKHEGLIFAVAFESVIKLAAFLAVGLYVTYGLFSGFGDILGKIGQSQWSGLLRLGEGSATGYSEWASLMFMSMMAIMFLPRQFHVAVVENHDERHILKAMWMFPLYLLLINIFVLPIAFGGLLLGGDQRAADTFVLSIPMSQGNSMLTLLVFLGGFSAATGMLIVESLAISNMVMNNLITPFMFRYRFDRQEDFPTILINIKRIVIFLFVFAGYVIAVNIGEFYTLVDMGLKSFEAVTIFAPAVFFGLYWKRGNRWGAMAGVLGGFVVWLYMLLLPAMVKSGVVDQGGIVAYVMGSEHLNPLAFMGMAGLDRWSHSLFWGLSVNITLFVGVSLLTRRDESEERQALLFVESFSPAVLHAKNTVDDISEAIGQYIGRPEAQRVIEDFMDREGLDPKAVDSTAMMKLREEARRVLSGALGSPIAALVLEDHLAQTTEERAAVLESIRQMTRTLRLSRQELAETNRQLAFLKEFSENIIESIPLGVATVDTSSRVTYWNGAMKRITGTDRNEAMGLAADRALRPLMPELFGPSGGIEREGGLVCSSPGKVLSVYVTRLMGGRQGRVLVVDDITEKRKIEEELFRTTKHASIGRLAAGVSHEIGNPLASISSLVQEMIAEDTTPFVGESLDTIHHHVDRIARIVRSLGDFARLHTREKAPADLAVVLESTMRLVRYDKNFKKINLHVNLSPVPAVVVDTDQMQQVFLNLFLNASDAMPEGGDLTVTLRPSAAGGVEVEFSDTGKGVDEAVMDKIFDPFFSTKGPARGTGLGLSISYSIIKDHGGTISVRSGRDRGASFVITLPAAKGEAI